MKKLFVIVSAMIFAVGNVSAQEDNFMFNHLSAGIGVGTTGIEIQVGAPLTDHFEVRAGYSFMPKIKFKPTIDFNSNEDFLKKEDGSGYYDKAEVEAKLNMGDFKLLFDYFPSSTGLFHITAGAYIGKSQLAKATTTNTFINSTYWGNSGPELGSASQTYTVVSDNEGRINAEAKVNSFKPYIGIGVGRAVPTNRLNVSFDFGVQFWGKPELWTNIDDNFGTQYRKVETDKILGTQDYCKDIKDALDIVDKVIVYPVLTVRLNGRIF